MPVRRGCHLTSDLRVESNLSLHTGTLTPRYVSTSQVDTKTKNSGVRIHATTIHLRLIKNRCVVTALLVQCTLALKMPVSFRAPRILLMGPQLRKPDLDLSAVSPQRAYDMGVVQFNKCDMHKGT